MMAPEGLCIRPMTEGDVEAVMILERSSDGAPRWTRSQYLDSVQGSVGSTVRRFAIVAEWKGALAGFAVLRLVAAPGGGEAELESIAVAPELRGREIGTALVTELIQVAKAHRAGRLDLEVRASNTAAMRVYSRLGWVETGRRRSYYDTPEEDAVLMRLNL